MLKDIMHDKDRFLSRVIYRLVNTEANPLIPSRVVIGSLRITYRIYLADVVGEDGTILVNQEMIENLGLTEEDIY